MNGRTLIVSQRELWDAPWFSYCVEFETALAAILGASTAFITTRDTYVAHVLRNRYRLRTALSSLPMAQAFKLERAQPEQQFDLGVIVVNDLQQLGILGSIPGWRNMADRFVAFVVELWPMWLEQAKPAVDDVVSQFSAVFTSIECTAADLGTMSGVPVHFLPPGVDTLSVIPSTTALSRFVSVANRGRREPIQHQTLDDWATRTNHVYEFDTGPLLTVESHQAHRRHYLEQCGRSRVYITNFARFDQPQIREGTEELGLRYFEGLASGCALAGQHPADDRLHRLLGDEARVLDFALGSREVPDELAALIDDDDALSEAARINRALALRRHDVLHRWDEVAGWLDLGPSEGGERRRARLREAHDALVA